jgi:GTP-binding protein Era
VHRADAQLVVIDTPGLHKPRTLLGERLNQLVRDTWDTVDVVGVCLPCDQRPGPGDAYIVGEIAKLAHRPKLVALATKTDLVSPTRQRQHLLAIQKLGAEAGVTWEHIVPVSATTGDQVTDVADVLCSLLPVGLAYYLDGEITDEPSETLVANSSAKRARGGPRRAPSITVVIERCGSARPPDDRPA